MAALMFGLTIGIAVMFLVGKRSPAETATAASASASAEPEPSASASAEPSASASANKPYIDPAAAARARKLRELRKKVRVSRSKKMDSQCRRFRSTLPAGYVFQGGTFAENQMVANAQGCVALAKTTKAPWFCCRK